MNRMFLKKFYLKCLSHGSYFLADPESREAAIVDPQRDVDRYLALLKEDGYRLKFILETHVHADFISGHWDLAAQTGAEVVYGAKAKARRPHRKVREGEELRLGTNISIRILDTPGHSPESICYLVRDLREPDAAPALFSGDTLFDGAVGRPDLLGAKMPAADLASMLYDTIEKKLKPLPDETRVYPAHGAGSACGKHIGDAEFTTIGKERKSNEAFHARDREDFIRLVTSDLPDAPAYFSDDARLNLEGMRPLVEVVRDLRPLSSEEVMASASRGAILLDTRAPEAYASGSLPNAINIGLDGPFAPWVGTLLPMSATLVLLCPDGREKESAMRCGRIGYENVAGYLQGGIASLEKEKNKETEMDKQGTPLVRHERLQPSDFVLPQPGSPILLDVRSPPETEHGSIPGAVSMPLIHLQRDAHTLDRDRPIRVYCGSGYRSSMAVSLLLKMGRKDVRDLVGGFTAYRQARLPIVGAKAD